MPAVEFVDAYHVYMMPSVYVGVTNGLERRVCQHMRKLVPGPLRPRWLVQAHRRDNRNGEG